MVKAFIKIMIVMNIFLNVQASARLCEDSFSSSFCLSLLLNEKCKIYGASNFGQYRTYQCNIGVDSFMKYFDMGTVNVQVSEEENKTYYVAFHEDLLSLIQKTNVQNYIRDLKTALESAYKDDTKTFSLWDYTFSKAGTTEKAMHWIAVLLQDTSRYDDYTQELERAPFLTYLRSHVTGVPEDVLDSLDEVTALLDGVTRKNMSNIRLYSAGFNGVLSNRHYHFYTIAWASRQMLKNGTSKEMSYFVPMMFNSVYEFRDYSYRGWPIKDPGSPKIIKRDPFDPSITKEVSAESSVKDVYTGYAGAIWGADELSQLESYNLVKTKIYSNTASWMFEQFNIKF